MRLVRLDDYPYGVKHLQEREWVYPRIAGVCRVLNRNRVPFILGCVPFIMTLDDAELLRRILPPYGKAVMHGFTHGHDFPSCLWHHLEHTWNLGGEFIGMDERMIERRYAMGDTLMKAQFGTLYDPHHFIAPFNVYSSELIKVLRRQHVKYLHTADEQHVSPWLFGHGIEAVVSEHGKTYNWVDKVINHLDNPSQITLHWSFDCEAHPNEWMEKYETFAREIVRHENAA